MQRFTGGEPPEKTGDQEADLRALSSWCGELYQNLWLIYFLKDRETGEEGQE